MFRFALDIFLSFRFKSISHNNGFGLCVRAGFGAQNCQPALNLNRIEVQSSKFACHPV